MADLSSLNGGTSSGQSSIRRDRDETARTRSVGTSLRRYRDATSPECMVAMWLGLAAPNPLFAQLPRGARSCREGDGMLSRRGLLAAGAAMPVAGTGSRLSAVGVVER